MRSGFASACRTVSVVAAVVVVPTSRCPGVRRARRRRRSFVTVATRPVANKLPMTSSAHGFAVAVALPSAATGSTAGAGDTAAVVGDDGTETNGTVGDATAAALVAVIGATVVGGGGVEAPVGRGGVEASAGRVDDGSGSGVVGGGVPSSGSTGVSAGAAMGVASPLGLWMTRTSPL